MNDLKEQRFILKINKDTNKLTRKKDLLKKWMEAYEIKSKPALLIGTFRFLKNEDFINWKSLPLKNRETQWGGEPAGESVIYYYSHIKIVNIRKRFYTHMDSVWKQEMFSLDLYLDYH